MGESAAAKEGFPRCTVTAGNSGRSNECGTASDEGSKFGAGDAGFEGQVAVDDSLVVGVVEVREILAVGQRRTSNAQCPTFKEGAGEQREEEGDYEEDEDWEEDQEQDED
ncbi:MAG TPA: hypothetical protein VGQ99_03190 [Tepidisphaeraceae bacterium]|nr:hypothetical protein [Tepidisphaeraceae bacterium]